ncbi:low-complexity protein [Hydrococcus rivularis NIES-593]|uniref:Low-complexity protein n=1 Tax=Hydrococcus rivularis NIES-593 TaxID=1921803 RepID=A0A1U7HDG6_9CYAN|nr:pentapeptide repeat-containing protein [Hydrococcus rivularis]OKH21585.1 low-complexity protein [Hydrococcus rivularis NIES-593]
MTDRPDSSQTPNPSKTLQDRNGNPNSASQASSGDSFSTSTEQANIVIPPPQIPSQRKPLYLQEVDSSNPWLLLATVAVMGIGLWSNVAWIGFSGALVALFLSLRVILPSLQGWISRYLTPNERRTVFGFIVFLLAVASLIKYFGFYRIISNWLNNFKYDEFGSWAEWVGALGQIMIAILAVYVAWEQYVISKDLTIQQNRITQQQTIDAYFQGISDLALDEEGLLEDWPQERAIAEGRTAALMSSVDATGKAKILRFLSQSKLLTPIARDRYLGRPILDGSGGYAEDRSQGIRVINLGVMLALADLAGQDLRWTDLSEANMVRANLSYCDLVKANLSRTILYEANLRGADLKGARLFYGSVETASPRSRNAPANYQTGAHTGTVIENADLTGVQNLSEEQRYYCCAWGGEKTRSTIPGGCEGIPNQLGR